MVTTQHATRHATILAAALVTAAAIGLGSHAAAQTIQGGFEFRVSNVVSPSQPTATVEVWAWFDNVPGVSELFLGANFDLIASEPLFVDFRCTLSSTPSCGANPPIIRGSSVTGVIVAQIHIPAVPIFGDPSNPILVFEADWTTTDFAPRNVSLETVNTNIFYVAAWLTGAPFQVWPQGYVGGSGVISVVPAPASLVGLSGVFVIALRRRRSIGTEITDTSL